MRPTFQVEPFATAWPDVQELALLHWREIAIDQATIELEPAVAQYERMEAAGQLLFVTARVQGLAVGYHSTFIHPHLHYASSLTAYVDGFFLHRQHRLDRNVFDLFRFVDAALAQRGVVRTFASSSLKLDLLPLFRALGWTEIERTFTKKVA